MTEEIMNIRKMTLSDYENVYDLWLNTAGMGLNDIDDSKQGIEKYLRRNPETCFVAEDDGILTGVILSGHDGRRGYIHHTAVRNGFRRRGIGSALLNAAVEALEREGIAKIALVVFERNETGNAFWERKGFGKRTDLVYRNRAIADIKRIDT